MTLLKGPENYTSESHSQQLKMTAPLTSAARSAVKEGTKTAQYASLRP